AEPRKVQRPGRAGMGDAGEGQLFKEPLDAVARVFEVQVWPGEAPAVPAAAGQQPDEGAQTLGRAARRVEGAVVGAEQQPGSLLAGARAGHGYPPTGRT